MSKGSSRRPTHITKENFNENWDKIFSKRNINVVELNDIRKEKVIEKLEHAKHFNLTAVMIIGSDDDNKVHFTFTNNNRTALSEVLFTLELAKDYIIRTTTD